MNEQAQEWLEDFDPGCPVCDPDQLKECTFEYKGSVTLAGLITTRFVCKDCGHVLLVDLTVHFQNKLRNLVKNTLQT